MSNILLCSQSMNAQLLNQQCGIDISSVHGLGCTKPNLLVANQPYILGNPTVFDKQVVASLSSPKVSQGLTQATQSFGADNTQALAEILSTLQEHSISTVGATGSIYANRIDRFTDAVKDYQNSLMEYRTAVKAKSPTKSHAKQKAFQSFENLQYRFRNELSAVNAQVKARKGTLLTDATRATNIAKDSRHVAKLNISSQVEAHNLVKFTQHAKFLGGGWAVIDFGSRIGNIKNSHAAGENWEREMFIESSSFALSAAAGAAVVKAGGAALSFMVVATPVGWVGLVAVGTVFAVGAAAASIYANEKAEENMGKIYDNIMDWMGEL